MEQRRRTASKFFPVYKPAMNFDFRNGSLPPEITFSRASTATFVGSNGLIQTAAANVPRFNYNPALSAIPRLLVEAEARTNLVLRSVDITNASWTKTRSSTPGTATTAPDGTATGYKLVEDATAANSHDVRQGSLVNGVLATYTQSIFAKKDTREWIYLELQNAGATSNRARAWFNLNTGVVGTGNTAGSGITYVSHSIVAYPNGWFRCVLTATAEAAVANLQFYTSLTTADNVNYYNGDGVSGLYLWGAQLEVGAIPSSYIPTTTVAVTRAADVATVTGSNFGKFFNQWTGTFAVKGVTPVGLSSVSQAAIEADFGDTNNRHVLFRSTSGLAQAQTGTNAVVQADITLGAWANTTIARQAYSYAPGNFNAAFAGVSGTPDNEGTPPQCSQLILGNTAAANRPWMGEYEWIRYWQQDADPKMVQYLTSNIYD